MVLLMRAYREGSWIHGARGDGKRPDVAMGLTPAVAFQVPSHCTAVSASELCMRCPSCPHGGTSRSAWPLESALKSILADPATFELPSGAPGCCGPCGRAAGLTRGGGGAGGAWCWGAVGRREPVVCQVPEDGQQCRVWPKPSFPVCVRRRGLVRPGLAGVFETLLPGSVPARGRPVGLSHRPHWSLVLLLTVGPWPRHLSVLPFARREAFAGSPGVQCLCSLCWVFYPLHSEHRSQSLRSNELVTNLPNTRR